MAPITIKRLQQLGTNIELKVRSLEGGLYVADLCTASQDFFLVDKHNERIKAKSATQLTAALDELPISSVDIIHSDTYDEMIGCSQTPSECTIPFFKKAI